MVIDKIENIGRYSSLLKNASQLKALFAGVANWEDGKEITDGEIVFSPFTAKPELSETKQWEIHRDNVDIHVAIKGRECIEWIPREFLKGSTGWISESDVEKFNDEIEGTPVLLEEGYFMIVLPDDAHKPSIKTKLNDGCVKCCFKVSAHYINDEF
jgi:YhcH/YjgK/YiaL family protein